MMSKAYTIAKTYTSIHDRKNTYTLTHIYTWDRLDRDTDGDGLSDKEEGVPLWRVPNREVQPLAPQDSDGDGIKGVLLCR
jgi:hypothetical protein